MKKNKISGIYLLVIDFNRLYVGQAINIAERIKNHKRKYKYSDFKYYIIQEIKEDNGDILKRKLDLFECYWIEVFDTYGGGVPKMWYNYRNELKLNKTRGNYKNSSFVFSSVDNTRLFKEVFGTPEVYDNRVLQYIKQPIESKLKEYCNIYNYKYEKVFRFSMFNYIVRKHKQLIKDYGFIANENFKRELYLYMNNEKKKDLYNSYNYNYNRFLGDYLTWKQYNEIFNKDIIYDSKIINAETKLINKESKKIINKISYRENKLKYEKLSNDRIEKYKRDIKELTDIKNEIFNRERELDLIYDKFNKNYDREYEYYWHSIEYLNYYYYKLEFELE